MRKEIKYSGIGYVLVRTDTDTISGFDVDVSLYSFDSKKTAKRYALRDIAETMRGIGVVYSEECDNAVSYEKYCGNDYWCYESDGYCISWEIRKLHRRTTGEWDNPNHGVKWVKDDNRSRR